MSGLWEDIKNAYFSYNGMGTNVFFLFVAIFYFLITNKKRQRNSSGDSGYPKMKQFQRNLKKQLEDLVSQMKNGEKGKPLHQRISNIDIYFTAPGRDGIKLYVAAFGIYHE